MADGGPLPFEEAEHRGPRGLWVDEREQLLHVALLPGEVDAPHQVDALGPHPSQCPARDRHRWCRSPWLAGRVDAGCARGPDADAAAAILLSAEVEVRVSGSRARGSPPPPRTGRPPNPLPRPCLPTPR